VGGGDTAAAHQACTEPNPVGPDKVHPWLPVGYRMCTPEMARAMTSLWISLVPSKMV